MERAVARRLATAIFHFTAGIEKKQTGPTEITEAMAPGPLHVCGDEPVTAASIHIAYSHHGGVRSEDLATRA